MNWTFLVSDFDIPDGLTNIAEKRGVHSTQWDVNKYFFVVMMMTSSQTTVYLHFVQVLPINKKNEAILNESIYVTNFLAIRSNPLSESLLCFSVISHSYCMNI